MKFLIVALLPAVALGQLLAGGISDTTVSATYEPVLFAVDKIKEHLAATDGGQSQLSLLDIVKARTQVVMGQKLYLTLHVTGDYYCDVTVWYRAWLKGSDRLQLTDGPTCTKHQASARALGGRVGGVSQPKPLGTDNMVLNALNFAVCADNDRSNNIFATVLGDTSGVTYTEQVTSGMTYHFYNVPLVDSGCRKEGQCADMDLTSCAANVNGMKRTCDIVVQAKLWMNPPYTLSKMTC